MPFKARYAIKDKIHYFEVMDVLRNNKYKKSRIRYKVKCICGNIRVLRSDVFSYTKSCGCMNKGLVGQFFDKSEVKKFLGKKYGRHKNWEVLCSCGNKFEATTNQLKTGLKQNCGCKKNIKIKDYSKRKFGKLKVIKYSGRSNTGNNLWLCECECGNFVELAAKRLKNTQSCGCLLKESGINHPNRKGYKDIRGQIWAGIKCGANNRGLDFKITIKYAYELFIKQDKKCALTHRDICFSQTKKEIGTASLDRIDSSKGYIKGNVWWIHKEINRMKSNMSLEYFKQLCEDITINNRANGGLISDGIEFIPANLPVY